MRRQGRSSAFCSSMDVHSGLHTNSSGPAKLPPKICLHRILLGSCFCTVAAGKWLAETNYTMTCIQCYSFSLVRLLKCWQRMMTVTTGRGGGRGRRRSSFAAVEKHKMISLQKKNTPLLSVLKCIFLVQKWLFCGSFFSCQDMSKSVFGTNHGSV